jgi:hypothetical protein
MELVQSLIAQGAARYAGGRWSLPERLAAEDLPATAAETCARIVEKLSPLARSIAELHALAIHNTLERNDYARVVGDVSPADLDAAIAELLSQRILASDGRAHVFTRREWRPTLLSRLDAAAVDERHRMLATVYAKADAFVLERIHHLFAGGLEREGLDLLASVLSLQTVENQGLLAVTAVNVDRVADILDRALTIAERMPRPPREINAIRRALFASSVYADEANYFRSALAWLAQLKSDSGLHDYEAFSDAKDPGERLRRALTSASQRYAAAADQERVYNPEQAIKHLLYFVAISIAIGSRTQDSVLVRSLPLLLEPFAPLSPLVHAVWQNAIATRESVVDNRPEAARQRWLEVDAALSKVAVAELAYVSALRGAIAYGIGLIEARLGVGTAEQRASALESDPIQRVSATSLRRVARLHRGDFDGAERFRRKAELLALQANQRQMFVSTLTAELTAYALAGDLPGIREAAEAITPLAARFPGWRGYKHLSDGYFEQTRGDFEAACAAFERGLAVAEPDASDPSRCVGCWPRLEAGYVEVLVGLNRAAEGKARGERALRMCHDLGIEAAAFAIRRALALAEAKLGDFARASTRLDGVIDDMRRLDIAGLELGVTFEARARIAIGAGDTSAIEHFGRLTAREYRHGERSPLGARYERLMDEARRSGAAVLPELTEFHTKVTTSHWRTREGARSRILNPLADAHTATERGERVLRLICEELGAQSGHLYLHQEGGLELVASRGSNAPDSRIRERAVRFAAQLLSDECATVVETETSSSVASPWIDEGGRVYQFTLMVTESGTAKLCAGVVVIETVSRTPIDPSTRQLLADLTDELLRIGDASAITAMSS